MNKLRFSLIEFLIVIAVFSIMISLLSPSLERLKDSSDSNYCKNNLKQFGVVSALYSNDNDNWVVPLQWHLRDWEGDPVYRYWGVYLMNQIDPSKYNLLRYGYNWKGHESYLCPVALGEKFGDKSFLYYTYGANAYGAKFFKTGKKDFTYRGYHFNMINSPSSKMQYFDIGAGYISGGGKRTHQGWLQNPYGYGQVAFRHNSQTATNAVFFDTHVEMLDFYSVEDSFKHWNNK